MEINNYKEEIIPSWAEAALGPNSKKKPGSVKKNSGQ